MSLIRPLGLEFRVSRHFNSLTEFDPLGWLWLLLGCDQCSGASGACGNLRFATAELFSSGEDDKMQTYRIQTRCVIFIRIYLNVNGGFIHVLFVKKSRFTSLKEKKVLETADDVCLRSSSTVCRIPMLVVVRVDALVRRLSWL